jgi:hypothetical protein
MVLIKERIMRHFLFLFIVFAICFGSASCASSATPTPDTQATETKIAANIFATQTANAPTATNTPTITNTPSPTSTPRPTLTLTPGATAVPIATEVVLTSTLPSGWILYELQTSKFALALPSEWKRLDLSPGGLENSLAVVGELNPNYKGVLSGQTLRNLITSGFRFYALDLSPEALSARFPVSVNVLKLDVGIALPLDSVVSLVLEQLKNTADSTVPITHRRVTLSNIQAEEIKYGAKLATLTGAPFIFMVTQYVFLNGTIEYVITFGSPREVTENYNPIFEQIAQSFRLLK